MPFRKLLQSALFRSAGALAAAVIGVHALYLTVIRPGAARALEAAQQAGVSAPRDMVVILKDAEQEICLILMLWGVFLIAEKCIGILRERYLFDVDLVEGGAAAKTAAAATAAEAGAAEALPAKLQSALRELEALPNDVRESSLVRTLLASVRRFLITGDVQNTSDAIESSVETLAVKQEAGNSMIRYLIWAIPSIGFIGTVRGIGLALSRADQALAGDIASMTEGLGVAFNSTLVALLISIVLMFLLHQLQRLQDDLVVNTQAYCESFLLNRISQPVQSAAPEPAP